MRFLLVLVAVIALVGCASHPARHCAAPISPPAPGAVAHVDAPVPACVAPAPADDVTGAIDFGTPSAPQGAHEVDLCPNGICRPPGVTARAGQPIPLGILFPFGFMLIFGLCMGLDRLRNPQRYTRLAPLLLAGVLVLLPGCVSGSLSRFASVDEVDQLRADSDAADASIRADIATTAEKGKAAFEEALAAGQTETEALLAKWRAEADAAGSLAATADAKAAEAAQAARDARENDEGMPWWQTALLALAAALGVGAPVAVKRVNAARDAARLARGEPVGTVKAS